MQPTHSIPLPPTHQGVTDVYIRSDGCKAQFKCAANFYWVSRHQHAGPHMVHTPTPCTFH